MVEYQIVSTPFGEVLLAEITDKPSCSASRKIIFLEFIEGGALQPVLESLKKVSGGVNMVDISDKNLYPDRYLFSFNDLLDCSKISWDRLSVGGTPFQMKVWRTLFEVPFGEVLSYSQLAQRAGYPAAVRAVATVVASNPVSLIIPCHRIVRKEAVAPSQCLRSSADILADNLFFADDAAVAGGELLHHYGNYRWGWQIKSRLIEWERCRKILFSYTQQEYKKFSQDLIPTNGNTMLGVRLPQLRKIATDLAKNNWRKYLQLYEDSDIKYLYFEEIMLQGMVVNAAKMELEQRLKHVERFVPKIDNWAVCDTFCCGTKWVAKHKESVWAFLQPYLTSGEEFQVRFAVIMFLANFLDKEYIGKVLNALDGIKQVTDKMGSSVPGKGNASIPDNYYIEMAVAWCLATAAAKCREEFFSYIEETNLNNSVLKKTAQKMRDSYRISNEDKKLITEIVNYKSNCK